MVGDQHELATVEVGMELADSKDQGQYRLLDLGVISLTRGEYSQGECNGVLFAIREHE